MKHNPELVPRLKLIRRKALLFSINSHRLGTVEGDRTVVFSPADAASGVEILLYEKTAFLVVVDAFHAVTPFHLLPQDLSLLYLDPLLPNDVLSHLHHRHRILVRILRIKSIRRRLFELRRPLLSPHC